MTAGTGRIHSYDTFGTVDGPGIRFVLFLQGCALQCKYCHNPDTWDTGTGRTVTVEDVLALIEPYVSYYRRNGGGVTVSGGEPTLQAPFVAQLFRAVHERLGLHTALDTSGFCEPDHAAELLDATDLVLLDLKQLNNERHVWLTSQPNERILRFARRLGERGKPVWVRHVLVPGVTDDAGDLEQLGHTIAEMGPCVHKVELLPYHRMGVYKWQQLGRSYPLDGVAEPSGRELARARAIIASAREAVAGATAAAEASETEP